MAMTVDELIERLTEYRDVLGGDTEVRSMQQPNWPFEYSIDGLVSTEEMQGSEAEEPDLKARSRRQSHGERHDKTVFILEGTQLCYGSKSAWG